jgi:alkylglycerol monooxygenase
MLVRNIEVAAYVYIHEKYHLTELPWDWWGTWVVCMLGVDFAYYWVHRMTHGQCFE